MSRRTQGSGGWLVSVWPPGAYPAGPVRPGWHGLYVKAQAAVAALALVSWPKAVPGSRSVGSIDVDDSDSGADDVEEGVGHSEERGSARDVIHLLDDDEEKEEKEETKEDEDDERKESSA